MENCFIMCLIFGLFPHGMKTNIDKNTHNMPFKSYIYFFNNYFLT